MAAPDKLGPLVDQWGLELAKALAKQAIPELHQDSSTRPLIRRYRQFRRR